MHISTTIVAILVAGLASQMLAAKTRIPAIVVLICVGLALGPGLGLLDLGIDKGELSELIGLGVAVILFEGAMDLRINEFKRVGHGVSRLVIFGPPLAWVLGALAAHYVAGLEWPVAIVMGAILVVTGPTVIIPLLRQARLNKESSALLKWEGIVNDPVGVLLAVLAFQYFTNADAGVWKAFGALGLAMAAAAVIGGLGGWVIGKQFQLGWIPAHLKSPLLLVLVLVIFAAANLVYEEAGMLAVTVMGVVLGNMKLPEREKLLDFKASLTVILLSMLFIVIPAQLTRDVLSLIDWRIFAFVLSLMFVVRPLTVMAVTIKAPMRMRDRVLLAWVAPRGIVAAATAGVFGPALYNAGYEDANKLLPTVFLVILVTVVVDGFSLGPVARKLDLSNGESNGVMIVGASEWVREFALALHKLDVKVLVADGAYPRLKQFRMDDIPTYYGEVLSERAEHELDVSHLSYLLCATDNDYYNALVARAEGESFGYHRTFQLPTHQESSQEDRRLTLQRRGYYAFDGRTDLHELSDKLREGWSVRTTRLTEDFTWEDLQARLGKPDDSVREAGDAGELGGSEEGSRIGVMLGAVTASGTVKLFANERQFTPSEGSTVLYFGPERTKSYDEQAEHHEATGPAYPLV